jgi:hypothetical protein
LFDQWEREGKNTGEIREEYGKNIDSKNKTSSEMDS